MYMHLKQIIFNNFYQYSNNFLTEKEINFYLQNISQQQKMKQH